MLPTPLLPRHPTPRYGCYVGGCGYKLPACQLIFFKDFMGAKAGKLTELQERFCLEYMAQGHVFGNAAAAYRIAFGQGNMKNNTLYYRASMLLNMPKIQQRIAELRNEMAERLKIKGEDLLRHWVLIASADPNEVVRVRRTCCRYCWGNKFQRQWTEHEHALANAKQLQNQKPLLSTPPGGFGYNSTKKPNPKCPVCFGEGVVNEYIADTTELVGGARLLYQGIEKKRSGIKIILRNQDEAVQNIAKYLGLFGDKPKELGKSNTELSKISDLTNDPIEAAKVYQKLIREN